MASKLIINGVSKTAFQPDRSMTRAEFVTLLVRGLGLAEDRQALPFTDIAGGEWFAGAIGAAVKADLIGGYEDGSFRPDGTLTREQMAVLVVRALAAVQAKAQATAGLNPALARFADRAAISDWAAAAVGEAVARNIMSGVTDTRFDPSAEASRAQAAVMLKRMLQELGFLNE